MNDKTIAFIWNLIILTCGTLCMVIYTYDIFVLHEHSLGLSIFFALIGAYCSFTSFRKIEKITAP